jgi:hypothetical protein
MQQLIDLPQILKLQILTQHHVLSFRKIAFSCLQTNIISPLSKPKPEQNNPKDPNVTVTADIILILV